MNIGDVSKSRIELKHLGLGHTTWSHTPLHKWWGNCVEGINYVDWGRNKGREPELETYRVIDAFMPSGSGMHDESGLAVQTTQTSMLPVFVTESSSSDSSPDSPLFLEALRTTASCTGRSPPTRQVDRPFRYIGRAERVPVGLPNRSRIVA